MKNFLLTLIIVLSTLSISAQKYYSLNDGTESYTTRLLSVEEDSYLIEMTLNGFYTNEVQTQRGMALHLSNDDMACLTEKGEPELLSLSIPLIIDDKAKMDVEVVKEEYIEYHDFRLAPFKGHFPRSVNPDEVPYTYSEVYDMDAFFPSSLVKLDAPYILRDFRAQNIKMTPFAYNPQTEVLRVYNRMIIKVFKDGDDDVNVYKRNSANVKIDKEFKLIYESRFINYKENSAKYDVVDEEGDLLIICHDDFVDAMQDFVEWKNTIGRNTVMVPTTVTGTTNDDIKTYISDYYYDNPSLTHVLLVGDTPHIPGKYMQAGYYSGCSDWWYGQLAGDDYYNELIVGRFCVETEEEVNTHVNKVIHYERDIDASDTWLTIGQGVSKSEGSGHYGEDDYEHIDLIREDLLNYNYTQVYREYSNVSGATSSAALVSQHINEGLSIINYCNHGSPTSWGVFSYDNDDVNALVNDYKLPFVISVACSNGQYDYQRTLCFAETWLRATNNQNGNPTGAVGGMFSYISQPWIPPMYGQDEMIDILTESYPDNIKRTMGGVSLNGNMKVLDIGGNINDYYATYNTWILFGDPTLTLRNDVPADMQVSHNNTMTINAVSFAVNAVDADGARATLTRDGEIMGSAVIENGAAIIHFDAPLTTGEATLAVHGYNKITYIETINIVEGGSEPLSLVLSSEPSIINSVTSTNLNATATGGTGNYSYHWSPESTLNNPDSQSPVASPSVTTTYTCQLSDGENTMSDEILVIVVLPPTDVTSSIDGENVHLYWEMSEYADYYNVYRDGDLLATDITADSYLDADLAVGSYVYSVRTVYNDVESVDSESVSVTIDEISVNVTASPNMIIEGGTSSLTAQVYGATEEVSYVWTPAESLDNPNASNPIASPLESTNYTVTVTSGSRSASASTTVNVLKTPANVTAVKDGNDVLIEWNNVEFADYYILMRNGEQVSSDVSSTSYRDENLDDGSYCYTVKAVHEALVTPESAEACVEINECVPPKNLAASYYWYDNEFGALIDWDRMETSLTLTEYRIYRSKNNIDYELIGTLANVPGMSHYQYSDINNVVSIQYYKVTAYYAATDCESEYGLAANSDDDYVSVEITSVNENIDDFVNVYPNPAKDKIYIHAQNMTYVSMTNMSGQLVYSGEMNSDEDIIDVSDLQSGIYILNIISDDNIITKKINIVK